MNRSPGYIDGRRTRVGNVPQWGAVPNVPIPGTMEAFGIFEDFLSVEDVAADGSVAAGKSVWEFLEQSTGTIAQADEVGGAIVLTTGPVNEDSAQIILGSEVGGSAFKPAAGKHIWFEVRAKVGKLVTGTTFNYFIGLVEPDATIILTNAGAIPTDDEIIGFIARDGDTNWSFMGAKSDTQDINALGAGAVVDNSYHYFGFYVNGVTDVTCYYDRAVISAGALATANIPILGVMPAFAVKTGEAAGTADNITIDYIMCVQLR